MIENVRFLGAAGMFCRRMILIAAAGISMFHSSVTVYAWEDDQTAVRTEGRQASDPNADSQKSRQISASNADSQKSRQISDLGGSHEDARTVTLRVCNWEEYIDLAGWDEEDTIDLDSGDILGERSMIQEFQERY